MSESLNPLRNWGTRLKGQEKARFSGTGERKGVPAKEARAVRTRGEEGSLGVCTMLRRHNGNERRGRESGRVHDASKAERQAHRRAKKHATKRRGHVLT